MRKLRVAAVALGIALGFTAQAAHATETKNTRVYVYLANAHHNPNTVTTTCDEGNKPRVHTTVYNDHQGATGPEIVKIYREDGDLSNYQNWPVVAGPFTIPLGGHQDVTLPYGPIYNAVAIPAGNDPHGDPYTFPKYPIDFFTMASAGTADNSQLFPPGTLGQDNYEYPTAPKECLPKPPKPCDIKPTGKPGPDAVTVPTCPPCPTKTPEVKGDVAQVVPTCIPPTTVPPTTIPPTKPTTVPTTAPTTVPTTPQPTDPTSTVTAPPTTARPSASATPSGPTLAHTGASVVPLSLIALLLIAAGGGTFLYVRTARRH